jgi:hypothetical protein
MQVSGEDYRQAQEFLDNHYIKTTGRMAWIDGILLYQDEEGNWIPIEDEYATP